MNRTFGMNTCFVVVCVFVSDTTHNIIDGFDLSFAQFVLCMVKLLRFLKF